MKIDPDFYLYLRETGIGRIRLKLFEEITKKERGSYKKARD